MSKFKQLLALSTRLLEQEDTIIILRSELLTVEDSRSRVGADLAEALRNTKDLASRAETLDREVTALQGAVSAPPVEYSTARDMLKSLGYGYAGGAWMNLKPAAPPLDVTQAIARLKGLGYSWTGQEWLKQVNDPFTLPPVASLPPVMPPVASLPPGNASSKDSQRASSKDSQRARNKCVHCKEVGHFSIDCPFVALKADV